MVDVQTVTSVSAVSAQGSAAASPATVDSMFDSILQNMNDPTTPQAAGMVQIAAALQMPITQSAATPLGGIIALLQTKSDIAGLSNADPTTDSSSGLLIVPADTLNSDSAAAAANDAQQNAQVPMPFLFRPAPPPGTDQTNDTAAVPAPIEAAPVEVAALPQDTEQTTTQQQTATQQQTGATQQTATHQNTGQATAPLPPANNSIVQQDADSVPADLAAAKAAKDKASQEDSQKTDTATAPQPVPLPQPAPLPQAFTQQTTTPTVVPPQSPLAGQPPAGSPVMTPAATNDATAGQPVAAKSAKAKMPSPAQQGTAKAQSTAAQTPLPQTAAQTAATDGDTPPVSDNNADKNAADSQQKQAASTDPAPPVVVAPMAAPVQSAPAAANSDTPDQTTQAAPLTAHAPSAPHPAKPESATAPANGQTATPFAETPNNKSALQNSAGQDSAAAGTPQADNSVPAPAHQSSSQTQTPPVAPINPALAQAAPSGLRKLTGGLQVSPQEQETTSTLDKFGVSIVTRAAEGLRHFDIRLDPPELGRVDVRLSVDDSGKAQASLLVDKPATLEMLQRDSSSLHRALSDAGLDLSNNGLNFSLRDQGRQNDGGVDQGRGRALSAKAVVQTDATPIHSSLGSYAPNSVRLDIRV